MSDAGAAAAGSMSCPECGKRYPWKDKLAGRKVRCTCGTVFEAAMELSADDDAADDGLGPADEYGVADDPPPARATVLPPMAGIAHAAPLPAPAGPQDGVLSYRRTDPADVEAVRERTHLVLRHFYVPALLLVAGLVLWGMRMIRMHDAVGGGAGQAVLMVVLGIVVNVGLLTAAVAVAGSLLGADFGPWNHAALKVAAIGTLVGAIGGIISGIDLKGGNGPIVALHAVVVLYWVLFYAFFDLDVQESLMTVVIVAAFQIGAFCIVFQ